MSEATAPQQEVQQAVQQQVPQQQVAQTTGQMQVAEQLTVAEKAARIQAAIQNPPANVILAKAKAPAPTVTPPNQPLQGQVMPPQVQPQQKTMQELARVEKPVPAIQVADNTPKTLEEALLEINRLKVIIKGLVNNRVNNSTGEGQSQQEKKPVWDYGTNKDGTAWTPSKAQA